MKLYNLGCVDLFRCVFCRNLAKQPKIMSCMHTACYECLRKHFEPESSQIRCNACDAVNTVKNVETFGNHDYVRNILDILASTQANSDNLFSQCSLCEAEIFENTLLFTCLTCSDEGAGNGDSAVGQSKLVNLLEFAVKPTARIMLCASCFDHHCLQNQSHSLFACVAYESGGGGADLLSREEGRLAECRKHKQTLTSFCLKLKRPMCELCLKSHNSAGHSHLCGVDVKCHVKSSVECGKRFQTNIHAYNRRANEIMQSFNKEKEANIQNTKKLFEKLRDILDQNENRIMKQLDEVYDAKFSQLSSVEEQGSFFAALGDRLTQTASDLLCLSSDQETYSFVSIIDTVASQLTQFSAGLEEEVRQILKDKPEISFKKRLFEDFVKTQYVSVEVKTAKLVDSLCCSLSDVPESRLTQLTISSDILTGLEPNNNHLDITAKDFKVELSMPGRQPVFVPVDSKESIESVSEAEQGEGANSQVKSVKFVAYIDPETVTAGEYNLKVLFRDQLVKSGPDKVMIYPKFDSGEIRSYRLFELSSALKRQHKISEPEIEAKTNKGILTSSPCNPNFVGADTFMYDDDQEDNGEESDIELLPDEEQLSPHSHDDATKCSRRSFGDELLRSGKRVSIQSGTSAGSAHEAKSSAFQEDDTIVSSESVQGGTGADYDEIVHQLDSLDLENGTHMVTINDISEKDSGGNTSFQKARRIKSKPRSNPQTNDDEINVLSDGVSAVGTGMISDDSYVNYYCDRFKFSILSGTPVRAQKLFTLGAKGKNNSNEGFFQYPIGCAVAKEGDILICDHGNNRVQIFDEAGQFKQVAGKGILERPSAVVCSDNGGFAVRADNGIYFFDKNGTNLPGRTVSSKLSKFCYGLAAVGIDELVFVNTNRSSDGSLVRINWDGKLQSETRFEPLCGKKRPPNSKCRFMDVFRDHVYMSDLGDPFLF
ncbi:uncharacterized protein LOC142335932 isoform X3 [Convolutriloba macropyga]|uniref:uncharacterized protein LOC142335932 isoform X3 n=1 Tax=Convolutriloba macropyga TaxID=536237 RepID=UPI003F52322A